MKKKLLWSGFLIIFLLLTLLIIYEDALGDFRDLNLHSPLVHEQSSFLSFSQDEKNLFNYITDQHFYWLDQGHQIYAFSSADGKYVLKIFKFKRLQPSWIRSLPSYFPMIDSYNDQIERKRINRLHKLFQGYKTAFNLDAKNSGLLFLHLYPTEHLKKEIVIHDRLNGIHHLNLDRLSFAIQRRAQPTKKVLAKLIDNKRMDLAEEYVKRLIEMYHEEYEIGLIDQDHNVLSNTGFIGETPIRMDVGQLKYDESYKDSKVYDQDLLKVKNRIEKWWEKNGGKNPPF